MQKKLQSRAGFTLIELLVVIGIILIVSSILFFGGRGGDGAKLSSAQRIVSGIAQGARGQAILKNSTTRLIIYSEANTSGNPEKFLRFFGIVYFEELRDETGTVTDSGWRAATQGTYLPEGIYFNKALSKDWPESTMNLDYPRTTLQSTGDEFYYYEFNSNGTMAQVFQNAWLALQVGVLTGSPPAPEFPATAEDEGWNLKTALIFRRAGTTTPVNDPANVD